MTASILCIGNDPAVEVVLERVLTRVGHRLIQVSGVDEALRVVARTPVDLIIADYELPGVSGLDFIVQLGQEGHRIPVITMTGHSSIEQAVMSIKSGAVDYLTKPIQPETLEVAVRRTLEVVRLRRENETLRGEIGKTRVRQTLIGESEPFRLVMELVGTAAAARAPVLLHGEPGTGKKLFARAIHDLSPRADRPFITVNCAALPDGLAESVLFGHETYADTGTMVRSAGAFERAHHGTLMLEEIFELRSDLQSKLLRVIQQQELERVGGQEPLQVNVRLIATTSHELSVEVDPGRFRGDLYRRLNLFPIRTPSLRERLEDLPRLVQHFVSGSAELHGGAPPAIGAETLEMLRRYAWPGNVRELANAVERAVLLCRGDQIQPGDFDQQIRAAAHPARPAILLAGGTPGAEVIDYNLDAIERLTIERALAATGGIRTKAARLLGISERTLRNKLNSPRAASGD